MSLHHEGHCGDVCWVSFVAERDGKVLHGCHSSSSSSWRMAMASVVEAWEVLVGISCRVVKVLELASSMLHKLAFNTFNFCVVGEAFCMVFVCIKHHWEVMVAVEMFIVIMTFDGVLWGMPIATVLENYFLKMCRWWVQSGIVEVLRWPECDLQVHQTQGQLWCIPSLLSLLLGKHCQCQWPRSLDGWVQQGREQGTVLKGLQHQSRHSPRVCLSESISYKVGLVLTIMFNIKDEMDPIFL